MRKITFISIAIVVFTLATLASAGTIFQVKAEDFINPGTVEIAAEDFRYAIEEKNDDMISRTMGEIYLSRMTQKFGGLELFQLLNEILEQAAYKNLWGKNWRLESNRAYKSTVGRTTREMVQERAMTTFRRAGMVEKLYLSYQAKFRQEIEEYNLQVAIIRMVNAILPYLNEELPAKEKEFLAQCQQSREEFRAAKTAAWLTSSTKEEKEAAQTRRSQARGKYFELDCSASALYMQDWVKARKAEGGSKLLRAWANIFADLRDSIRP